MKTQINKLIKEYQTKIDICDKQLTHIDTAKQRLRREGESITKNHRGLLTEEQIILTQRQAYIQAKVDTESLLDYI